jgi:hypothetical protein
VRNLPASTGNLKGAVLEPVAVAPDVDGGRMMETDKAEN